MKVIYLHIGRGKTGTTTIQSFLEQARASLRDSGVHYVLADNANENPGHHQFAKSFIANLPAYMVPQVQSERVREAVYDEICATPLDIILMSSENFPLADVSEVVRYFDSFPFEIKVKIIYFVRSHDELLESEYNQMVKLKREARAPLDYAAQAFEGVDYHAEARRWEQYLGRQNVICQIYDASRKDVVEQFLLCLPEVDSNLAKAILPQTSTYANSSIGIKALHVARVLNGIEIDDRGALYHELFSRLAESDLPAILFDHHQARRFRARFARSNILFTRRYLGKTMADLGGRRYNDKQRKELRAHIKALDLGL